MKKFVRFLVSPKSKYLRWGLFIAIIVSYIYLVITTSGKVRHVTFHYPPPTQYYLQAPR